MQDIEVEDSVSYVKRPASHRRNDASFTSQEGNKRTAI